MIKEEKIPDNHSTTIWEPALERKARASGTISEYVEVLKAYWVALNDAMVMLSVMPPNEAVTGEFFFQWAYDTALAAAQRVEGCQGYLLLPGYQAGRPEESAGDCFSVLLQGTPGAKPRERIRIEFWESPEQAAVCLEVAGYKISLNGIRGLHMLFLEE